MSKQRGKKLIWNKFQSELKGCDYSIGELSKLYELYSNGKISDTELKNCDELDLKLSEKITTTPGKAKEQKISQKLIDMSLGGASYDMLRNLMYNIPMKEILALCSVNRKFNEKVCNETFWRLLAAKKYEIKKLEPGYKYWKDLMGSIERMMSAYANFLKNYSNRRMVFVDPRILKYIEHREKFAPSEFIVVGKKLELNLSYLAMFESEFLLFLSKITGISETKYVMMFALTGEIQKEMEFYFDFGKGGVYLGALTIKYDETTTETQIPLTFSGKRGDIVTPTFFRIGSALTDKKKNKTLISILKKLYEIHLNEYELLENRP